MTLSKQLILSFADISKETSENLLLITPAGIISGRFPDSEKPDSYPNYISAMADMCSNEVSDYKKTLGLADNQDLPENEGYIILHDVTLLSSMKTISLPFAVVFYKDVIGISLGKFE